MIQSTQKPAVTNQALSLKLNKIGKKIAPLWSLENFVAVNPYMGLSDYEFDNAMKLLAKRGNIKATLPLEFYLKAISEGKITKTDIQEVLINKQHHQGETPEAFLSSLKDGISAESIPLSMKTVVEVSEVVTGKNWHRFMVERVSEWGASYFDKNQAAWKATASGGIFQAWKMEAKVDRTPEVTGLVGFRNLVKKLPDDTLEVIEYGLEQLNVSEEMSEAYLHKLLLGVGGWSAYVARMDWDNGLAGEQSNEMTEFLAVLLSWEVLIYQSLEKYNIQGEWYKAKLEFMAIENDHGHDQELDQLLILQSAFDLANQRNLIEKFDTVPSAKREKQVPKVQAIFCIDVRSEVYRRNLELASSDIATMGFAGFFAFPIKYVPLAHEQGLNQCPVLLNTSHTVYESLPEKDDQEKSILQRKLKHQIDFAWKSFKLGAISCFSFVGPIGLSYLPKLFTDSYGMTRPVPHPEQEGLNQKMCSKKEIMLLQQNHLAGIPLDQQIQMAEAALKAMSLTDNFARLVLIVGHGSSSVNNPHATGLDCGACGGHTGEANAKVAAAVLNNSKVRMALVEKGIEVPDTTYFLACQHDTTIDEVTIFNEDKIPVSHFYDVKDVKETLMSAGKMARNERALRMNLNGEKNIDKAIFQRSVDWSQVRPEWGLAGCSALVVAPRSRTKDIDFGGKSFLHSYDWAKDTGFAVLEIIMTAPMVVTSWINLQYYASTVDNKTFGSGNKALHNIVGGLGVFEGHSGDLRTGLPWQSVHDGEHFQHEPLRLNVIIEAPVEAMDAILSKHKSVRQLVDNEWIYLFAMNEEGKIAHKYNRDLKWIKVA